MAIFTIGNKPINFKQTYTDPYYKEWLADRLYNGGYPLYENAGDSLEECSARYLCFTCDFLSNSGNNSKLRSKIGWTTDNDNPRFKY